MYKKLVTPEFKLMLPTLDITSGFDVSYVSSKTAHCDYVKLYLEEETEKYISGQDISDCAVMMGNDGDYDELIQGSGQWRNNGKELWIRDLMEKLFQTIVSATFLKCHPQEAVRYILELSGVEKYNISDAVYDVKDTFTVSGINACDAIKEVNAAWNIDVAFFYWGDTFYWGTVPEQEELYELNDENVLGIEKDGDIWTAYIIGLPWIHHSQYITINHEDLIAVGVVEKCVLQSQSEGFTEMYLEFKEVED